MGKQAAVTADLWAGEEKKGSKILSILVFSLALMPPEGIHQINIVNNSRQLTAVTLFEFCDLPGVPLWLDRQRRPLVPCLSVAEVSARGHGYQALVRPCQNRLTSHEHRAHRPCLFQKRLGGYGGRSIKGDEHIGKYNNPHNIRHGEYLVGQRRVPSL